MILESFWIGECMDVLGWWHPEGTWKLYVSFPPLTTPIHDFHLTIPELYTL